MVQLQNLRPLLVDHSDCDEPVILSVAKGLGPRAARFYGSAALRLFRNLKFLCLAQGFGTLIYSE